MIICAKCLLYIVILLVYYEQLYIPSDFNLCYTVVTCVHECIRLICVIQLLHVYMNTLGSAGPATVLYDNRIVQWNHGHFWAIISWLNRKAVTYTGGFVINVSIGELKVGLLESWSPVQVII